MIAGLIAGVCASYSGSRLSLRHLGLGALAGMAGRRECVCRERLQTKRQRNCRRDWRRWRGSLLRLYLARIQQPR